MATGSGKTLLLHINYHQFLHYNTLAGGKRLNSILLITPNTGLSDQHLDEFAKSGIPAQRFRSSGSASLDRNTVQVLEITKLTERGAGRRPFTSRASRATTWSSWTKGTAAPAATFGCACATRSP